MTRVTLLAPVTAPVTGVHPTASAVIDMLWLHAPVNDGVGHIHARAGSYGFDVVVFTAATNQETADRVVRRMCDHAVRSVPVLRDWGVT